MAGFIEPISGRFQVAPGIGGIAMVTAFAGEYDAGTAYTKDTVVSYQGLLYVCIQDGTGQQPDTATTFWAGITAEGPAGPTGATGPAGSAPANAQLLDTLGLRTAGMDYNNQQLAQPKFSDWSETIGVATLNGSTLELDFATGNVFAHTLSATINDIAFLNVPPTGVAAGAVLQLTQAAAPVAVTWAVNGGGTIRLPGGTAPALDASTVNVVSFTNFDTAGDVWDVTVLEAMAAP